MALEMATVAQLLVQHDPLQVYFEEDANSDEYDSEARIILGRIAECRSEQDCLDLVWSVFKASSSEKSAGEREMYRELARDLWRLVQP